MSGVISFSERSEEIWKINNVYFRKVLKALEERMPKVADVGTALWEAEGISALMIDEMDPKLARSFVEELRRLTRDVAAGSVPELAEARTHIGELAAILDDVEGRYYT
jgi:hypothetical protein